MSVPKRYKLTDLKKFARCLVSVFALNKCVNCVVWRQEGENKYQLLLTILLPFNTMFRLFNRYSQFEATSFSMTLLLVLSAEIRGRVYAINSVNAEHSSNDKSHYHWMRFIKQGLCLILCVLDTNTLQRVHGSDKSCWYQTNFFERVLF